MIKPKNPQFYKSFPLIKRWTIFTLNVTTRVYSCRKNVTNIMNYDWRGTVCLHICCDVCAKDSLGRAFVKVERFFWSLRMWVSLLGLPNVGVLLLFEGRTQVWKKDENKNVSFLWRELIYIVMIVLLTTCYNWQ